MARRRRRYIPPPPPISTFVICNPADNVHVITHYRKQTNEDVIASERCPEQHLIRLPNRLKLLAISGSWFEVSPDAQWIQVRMMSQSLRVAVTTKGKPRCQAWQKNGTQCPYTAVPRFPGDTHEPPRFCKTHETKREFGIHEPGAGLDEPNPNPLDRSSLEEISSVAWKIGTVLAYLQRLQSSVQLIGEDSERVGEAYADLHDCRSRLEAIVKGDRQRDAKLRRELTHRINRMVDRICVAKRIENGMAVHMAYINSGGKKHAEMTIEELKAKIDWLMRTYEDVFPADTREWEPPDAVISGMEPGGIRARTKDDPVIETEEA